MEHHSNSIHTVIRNKYEQNPAKHSPIERSIIADGWYHDHFVCCQLPHLTGTKRKLWNYKKLSLIKLKKSIKSTSPNDLYNQECRHAFGITFGSYILTDDSCSVVWKSGSDQMWYSIWAKNWKSCFRVQNHCTTHSLELLQIHIYYPPILHFIWLKWLKKLCTCNLSPHPSYKTNFYVYMCKAQIWKWFISNPISPIQQNTKYKWMCSHKLAHLVSFFQETNLIFEFYSG